MNWEAKLSIVAICISVFSLLFYTIYPSLKKYLKRKAFSLIRKFYFTYQSLNPYLNWEINKITAALMNQSIFYYGFPRFEWLVNANFDKFDPSSFENSGHLDSLSFYEICKFLHFWRLLNRKIKNISKVVIKHKYIVKNEARGDLTYNNSFGNGIKRTSISICPSFDKLRLFGAVLLGVFPYVEKRVNLNDISKNRNDEKKFKKELKSDLFSINIEFRGFSEEKSYSYSLNFGDGGLILEIVPFFAKQYRKFDLIDKQEFDKHKKWIAETFDIPNIDEIIRNLPPWQNVRM